MVVGRRGPAENFGSASQCGFSVRLTDAVAWAFSTESSMLPVAILNGLSAFSGPVRTTIVGAGNKPSIFMAIEAGPTLAGVTGYVARLESQVASLSSKLGVLPPKRCEGESCYELNTYIEILEETASTLEAQWKTAAVAGADMAAPLNIPDAIGTQGTLTMYMKKLEAKVEALASELNVPAPQQCEGDACMSIEVTEKIGALTHANPRPLGECKCLTYVSRHFAGVCGGARGRHRHIRTADAS